MHQRFADYNWPCCETGQGKLHNGAPPLPAVPRGFDSYSAATLVFAMFIKDFEAQPQISITGNLRCPETAFMAMFSR